MNSPTRQTFHRTVRPVVIKCRECACADRANLVFGHDLKLVDSDGGMLFREGWTCARCLGQAWASSDVTL